MNEIALTQEQIPDVLKELEQAFLDIPFGNTAFQTENFVVNAALTPERAYRAIGLQMFARIQALKEAQYNKAKDDINLAEFKEKIADPKTDKYERMRLELEVDKILDGRSYSNKLIKDAICEVSQLYKLYKRFPQYTREQFEAGEKAHYIQSLNNQLQGITGAAESLKNMGELAINGVKSEPLLSRIGMTQIEDKQSEG
jgi:hypothetical protein